MANFFIGRPIVAIVISILIVMIGVIVITGLSVEQYPFLAPPNIRVTANYPGASAEAVEQSVATPIEQEVNGVDSLIYMKSSNTSDGRMLLDVNFEVGTDQDTANVLTQNRVSTAQARLPAEVTQQGVTVKKQSPSILMLISLYSPKDSYDANFLINYCGINLRDQMLRIPGIAQVDLFGGTDYGMRIWIEARQAGQARHDSGGCHLGHQRAEHPGAGREGRGRAHAERSGVHLHRQRSGSPGHARGVRKHHRPSNCHRRGGPDQGHRPRRTRLAGLQLVRPAERQARRRNGRLSLPGANQLKAAETIYETMEHAKSLFPPDMDYKIVYDTTPAVEASIHEILKTFVEALILVTLVVFIFLQNIRATIIPLITVPVSLIGTFIFFPLLGFSLNTLSMFGLVLAIGIVVDDAIVVVEAVIHHLEHGLAPKEATDQSHGGSNGTGHRDRPDPLCGVRPVALLGGLVGSMYKQFALTIAISVLLSAFNALSLTPALCAMLLKPPSRCAGRWVLSSVASTRCSTWLRRAT